MSTPQKSFIRLAVIVAVWYLALTYLPQITGTCMDGECGFTPGEIVISFAIPLVIAALNVALEMKQYRKTVQQALHDIGLTRFSWGGIRIATIYLLPLLLFYPLFALLTNTPLVTQPNGGWRLVSALLINGIVEEMMMRGFVFRHLREGRSFWRAAALSTVYFAAYHVMLIFTAGPVIGIIAVAIAVPAGFLMAYIYERGSNTLWGPVLGHAVYNALSFVFIFPAAIAPAATSLYLVAGIVVSTLILLRAYRTGYGREGTHPGPDPVGAVAVS